MKGLDADQNTSREDAKEAAEGGGFVARYLKNLSRAEVDAAHAAGLGVVLIWETTAERALSGYGAGMDDGRKARAQAQELGAPDTAAIYATADFDATEAQQEAVLEYFRGFALTAGKTGEYANGAILASCIGQTIGSYTWLAGGLGMRGSRDFLASGKATIVQDVGDKAGFNLGIDIDSDTAIDGEIGAWLPTAEPTVDAGPPGSTSEDALHAFTAAAGSLQAHLKALGFYQGRLDSDWGPASRAALTAYLSGRGGTP